MARKYMPLLLFLFAWTPLGCGGLSQEDLRQYSYKRHKDNEDEQPAPAPQANNPNTANPNPAAVPPAASENLAPQPAAQNQPSQTNVTVSAASTGSQNPAATSPATNTSSEPVAVASAVVSSDNPLDAPTPKALADSPGGEQNQETPVAAKKEDEDKPPVITEDSTPGELQAYHDWHTRRRLKEQAAVEAAERRSEQAAKNVQAATNQGTTGDDSIYVSADNNNYYNDSQALKQLFNRLTNPGSLSPEEFGRVAQELAYDDATKEALLYHYARLLTTEKTDEVKKHMAWSPALQRPLAAIHWGLGLEFSGDPNLLSKANPINSQVFQNMGRRHSSGKMQALVGELGDRLLLGLDDRFETGSLGSLLKPPANQSQRQPSVKLKWEPRSVGFTPETLGRGITLLKGGSYKELMYFSKLEEIDVLVIYDMNLKQGKNGPVVNITKLKFVDVARNKEIFSSPQFHNIKTNWARQDRAARDPVEKDFESIFAQIDELFKLQPLPDGLNEENATQRIEALAASEPANPLSVMAEMRLYQAAGLVGDAVLYSGYKQLIGDEQAKKLITGTPDERVKAIARFLPKLEVQN